MGMSLLSLFMGLSFSGDDKLIGMKRFVETRELARCVRRGTAENPILVSKQDGTFIPLRLAIATFTNEVDNDGTKGGIFEFEGIALGGERAYWGSMTNSCSDDTNGMVVNCGGEKNTGQLYKDTSGVKIRYFATQYMDREARKTEFAEEDCSFWPHGRPSLAERVVLFSVPFNRYCVSSGPIIFRIQNNSSAVNPLKIEFGNENSNCKYGLLSSPTNHEYWMDARNEFMDDDIIDPDIYKDQQSFDIDGDGDLDLVKVEKDLHHERYPAGAWSLVLYRK